MGRLERQTRFSPVTTARWPWLWLLIAGAAAIGVAFWADAAVVSWIAQHQSKPMRNFMRAVSWWGDWPAHIVIGLAGAGIANAVGNRRWMRIFAAMVLACAIAGLATRVVKVASGRSRPSVQQDVGWNGPRLSSKYHAFPSGHTASSTAFFATLLFASWRTGLAFLPVPLLIAFSRLYLRSHYLSDIVAAAVLGVAVALALQRSRLLTTQNPRPDVGEH